MSRQAVEIPGDKRRDADLQKLVDDTGFQTANKLLAFVAYEVARCKSPAKFYRALSKFHEEAVKIE